MGIFQDSGLGDIVDMTERAESGDMAQSADFALNSCDCERRGSVESAGTALRACLAGNNRMAESAGRPG